MSRSISAPKPLRRDERLRAQTDSEIEALHTRIFGPTQKSIVYKIMDLELHEIAGKLSKTLFKSNILNKAITSRGYGLGILDPYMQLFDGGIAYIFRTVVPVHAIISDYNLVPRAETIISIRDALIAEYPGYTDNIMEGYLHLIKVFSTLPNTQDPDGNSGADLITTYESADADFNEAQLPRSRDYRPALGQTLKEKIRPLLMKAKGELSMRMRSIVPNPVLSAIIGNGIDEYFYEDEDEDEDDFLEPGPKRYNYIRTLIKDARLTEAEQAILKGYHNHIIRRSQGLEAVDYQLSQTIQQRQKRQAWQRGQGGQRSQGGQQDQQDQEEDD